MGSGDVGLPVESIAVRPIGVSSTVKVAVRFEPTSPIFPPFEKIDTVFAIRLPTAISKSLWNRSHPKSGTVSASPAASRHALHRRCCRTYAALDALVGVVILGPPLGCKR